jgi:hypothetical protein
MQTCSVKGLSLNCNTCATYFIFYIEIVNSFPDELAKRFYETFGNNINSKINRATFADFIL